MRARHQVRNVNIRPAHLVSHIGIGHPQSGLPMPGHEQAFGGFVGLYECLQVARLRAAGRWLGRLGQRLQHFQPRDTYPLIGRLRPVSQIAIEFVPHGLFSQTQPRCHFRVSGQFGLRQRGHQLVHLPGDPAGCSGIVDGRRTACQHKGQRQAQQPGLQAGIG